MAVEQATLIRAGMDASGYERGARQIEAANQRISTSNRQLGNEGERTTRTVTQTARQFDKLVQSLDTSARAAAQFAAAEARINAAVTAGHAGLAEKNRLLELARQRYLGIVPAATSANDAIRLQGYQVQNLTAQFTDLGVQIGSGGGLFRPLLQQTPQMVDAVGGVSNAMRILRQNAAGLLTGGAILGVGAALVGIGAAAESNQRSINGLATGLQRSRSDFTGAANEINTAARRLAETTSLGTQQARDALGTLASVPGFRVTQENLIETGKVAQNLGAIFREDVGEGAKRLAEAFRDPAAAAQRYAEGGREGIRGFNEEFVRHIELLQAGGQRGEAVALVTRRIGEAAKGAADRVTPLQQAWRNLVEELTTIGNASQQASDGLGTRLTNGLASVITGARDAARAIREMRDALKDVESLQEVGRQVQGGGLIPFFGPAIQALRGRNGATNAAPVSNAVPADMQPILAQAAGRAGVDPELLARVYRQEAGRNADGSFRTSSAGAVGPLQVMPATFAELARRYNLPADGINDPQTNATAGALYLRDRLQARNGDVALGLADYNAGPGRVDGVLAGRSELPNETSRYVRTITRGYTGPGLVPATPAAISATPAAMAAPGGAGPIDSAAADIADRSARLAESNARGTSQRFTRQTLETELSTAQRDLAATPEGTNEYTDRLAAVERLRAELEKLKAPQDAFVEGLRRQTAAGGELDPTMRAVAQRLQDFDEAMRAAGRTGQEPEVIAARAEVQALAIRELTQEYARNQAQLDTQVQGQNRIAEAWTRGATAVSEATNREKAMNEVRASGIVGDAARGAEVERLTARYNALTAAQAAATVNQRTTDQTQQLESIALDRSLVGADPTMAAQDRAGLRARQDASRIPGITGAQTEGLVAGAREIAAANAALNDYQRSWKTVEGVAGSAIDKMGEGLLKLAEGGKDAFRSFQATAASVLQDLAKEILKMGVLNPLKNALLGGNQPTFGALGSGAGGGGGLGSLIGSLFSGGASSAGSGLVESAGKQILDGGLKAAFAGSFHEGGLVGGPPTFTRAVSPGIFREAPRYHTGGIAGQMPGLMPDEVPAILQRRELVMTEAQQAATRRALNAPRANVNINMPIYAANPDAFRASGGQAKAAMATKLRNASRNL